MQNEDKYRKVAVWLAKPWMTHCRDHWLAEVIILDKQFNIRVASAHNKLLVAILIKRDQDSTMLFQEGQSARLQLILST